MRKNIPIGLCDGMNVFLQKQHKNRLVHYVIIDGTRIRLHNYLANNYIRIMDSNEVVHHKDRNSLNNALDNLEIMTRASHIRLHRPVTGYKFTDEQKEKLRISHKGQVAWNKGKIGYAMVSEATRKKLSDAMKSRIITWGEKISKAKTKVTKNLVITILMDNPRASLKEVMTLLNIKSHSPIQKLGGLRCLRREIQIC